MPLDRLATTPARIRRATGRAHEFVWDVTGLKTGAYQAVEFELIRCDPSGAGFTVTLPKSALDARGHGVMVKNVSGSANVITIAAAGGGDTVEGAASINIAAARGFRWLVDSGVGEWMLVGS